MDAWLQTENRMHIAFADIYIYIYIYIFMLLKSSKQSFMAIKTANLLNYATKISRTALNSQHGGQAKVKLGWIIYLHE
jgi:hypothetical protein